MTRLLYFPKNKIYFPTYTKLIFILMHFEMVDLYIALTKNIKASQDSLSICVKSSELIDLDSLELSCGWVSTLHRLEKLLDPLQA